MRKINLPQHHNHPYHLSNQNRNINNNPYQNNNASINQMRFNNNNFQQNQQLHNINEIQDINEININEEPINIPYNQNSIRYSNNININNINDINSLDNNDYDYYNNHLANINNNNNNVNQVQQNNHHQQQQQQQQQRQQSINYLSFNFLSNLQTKNTNDIITTLSEMQSLSTIINSTRFNLDLISLFLDIITKIIQINSNQSYTLISSVLNSHFIQHNVKPLLSKPSYNKLSNPHYILLVRNSITFFTQIIQKYESFANEMPISNLQDILNSYAYILNDKELVNAESEVKWRDIFKQNETLKQIHALYLYSSHKQNVNKQHVNDGGNNNNNNNGKPLVNVPINYKSIKPEITPSDLNVLDDIVIQPHRIEGHYESYERYYNTLFYLEYEDCYRNLRHSLKYYRMKSAQNAQVSHKHNKDVYYYINAEIINCDVTDNGVLLIIDFESIRPIKKFTKRMIYGSLLIITDMNFNNFLLSTVHLNPYIKANNNSIGRPNQPGRYRIQVSLVHIDNNSFAFIKSNINKPLQIFESKAYYEAYIHIMKRLQHVNVDNLPFKDVLIEGNFTSMKPAYMNVKSFLRISDVHRIEINRGELTFPNVIADELDEHQLNAFRVALSSKIAIIQGPPGTGKSYIGALITRVLLENTDEPVLIVCYTNHALDQFLLQVLNYTDSVLRIGGRCTKAEIERFMVKNKRINKKELFQIHRQLDTITGSINDLASVFDSKKLLPFSLLCVYFPDFLRKLVKDFIELMDMRHVYNIQNKVSNHSELLYKVWAGVRNVEELIEMVIHDNDDDNNDEVFNNYLLLFERFNTEIEVTDYPAYEQVVDLQQQQHGNNIVNNNDSDGDSDDDDDEVNENDEREAFEIYVDNINNNYNYNLPINRGKLHQVQYTHLYNRYNLFNIDKPTRIKMHDYIKHQAVEFIVIDDNKINHYNTALSRKTSAQMANISELIRQHRIIAMTTTACAKYSAVIEQTQFRTIIVEEAAEVLESHIAALLTRSTEHLIMIGDHKQLRPKPYNYELLRKFNFDVSMFERLINNGIEYASLKYQRRMKPLFAEFVRIIYGNYEYLDHPYTLNKPAPKGFMHDMYIITHHHNETEHQSLVSRSNAYEAEYIVKLCKYIILQGYKEEQITILTLYVGQVIEIRSWVRKLSLNVRVSSVDNYQGEENDFVLLSLVRSNCDCDIGFLKTMNRVCVAFSRAKIGLFIIGNIDCIVKGEAQYNMKHPQNGNITVWKQIQQKAVEKGVIGPSLTLVCQEHKTQTTVTSINDFAKVPQGGCELKCNYRLQCGHVCELRCHASKHEHFKCFKPCARALNCGHKCVGKCCEECPPCLLIVNKVLPCGHTFTTQCSADITAHKCREQCERVLPCGHQCTRKCGDHCNPKDCSEIIRKRIDTCGHYCDVPCGVDVSDFICTHPCNKLLDCGHPCKGTCGECLNDTLHKPCQKICGRNLICGHSCKNKCYETCICKLDCKYECKHSKCPLRCGERCIECNEPCLLGCKHKKCSNLCKEPCDIVPCDMQCDKRLRCGHRCIGLCGEACPAVCRVCDTQHECFTVFFGYEDDINSLFYQCKCTHIFEVRGLDTYFNNNAEHSVQIPVCPKCKSVLTSESRYSRVIKAKMRDLQEVKLKIIEQNMKKEYLDKSVAVVEAVWSMDKKRKMYKIDNNAGYKGLTALTDVYGFIKAFDKDKLETRSASTFRLLSLLRYFIAVECYYRSVHAGDNVVVAEGVAVFNRTYKVVRKYFTSYDEYAETFLEMLTLKVKNMFTYVKIAFDFPKQAQAQDVRHIVGSNFAMKDIDDVSKQFVKFDIQMIRLLQGLGTTWYKCRNGHFYAVGNCGMFNQRGRCPECNEEIGVNNGRNLQVNDLGRELNQRRYDNLFE